MICLILAFIQTVCTSESLPSFVQTLKYYAEEYVSTVDAENLVVKLTHWVQSEYAKRFLAVNGVTKNIFFVGDYLDYTLLLYSQAKDNAPEQSS